VTGGASSQARRARYRVTGALAMLLYVVVLVPCVVLLDSVARPALRIPLAALPVLPLLWWGYEFIRMVHGGDEMQREIQLRALMISAGGVLYAGSLWGVFSYLLGWPEPPLFLFLPAAAVAHGLAMAALNRRYGG